MEHQGFVCQQPPGQTLRDNADFGPPGATFCMISYLGSSSAALMERRSSRWLMQHCPWLSVHQAGTTPGGRGSRSPQTTSPNQGSHSQPVSASLASLRGAGAWHGHKPGDVTDTPTTPFSSRFPSSQHPSAPKALQRAETQGVQFYWNQLSPAETPGRCRHQKQRAGHWDKNRPRKTVTALQYPRHSTKSSFFTSCSPEIQRKHFCTTGQPRNEALINQHIRGSGRTRRVTVTKPQGFQWQRHTQPPLTLGLALCGMLGCPPAS